MGELTPVRQNDEGMDFSQRLSELFITEMEDLGRIGEALNKIESIVLDPEFVKGLSSKEVISLYSAVAARKSNSQRYIAKIVAEGSKNRLLARFIDKETSYAKKDPNSVVEDGRLRAALFQLLDNQLASG